tara:strand:- start:11 stop:337 length:327 start_codon:yes stop_codon:yes gene_type:complete
MSTKKTVQSMGTQTPEGTTLKHSSVGSITGGEEPKLVLPSGLVLHLRQAALPIPTTEAHTPTPKDQSVFERSKRAGLTFYTAQTRFVPDGPQEREKIHFTSKKSEMPD